MVEAVDRLEPGVDFGPMITEAQYRKVLDHFDRPPGPRAL